MRQRKYRLHSMAALLITAFSITASAEENTNEDEEIWDMNLADILDIEVSVASSFAETELESGSTVALIEKEQWQNYGANNIGEALGHLPGTIPLPNTWGGFILPIRGYASRESTKGIATVIDGVPINAINSGGALYHIDQMLPHALNRIEMIRGPGSALYGADAFHGVLSLKTYEEDENQYQVRGTLSSENFAGIDTSISHFFNENTGVHLSLDAVDQGDRNSDYLYQDFTAPGQFLSGSREDSYDTQSMVLKLDHEFSETIDSQFGYYFFQSDAYQFTGVGRFLTGFSSFADRDWSRSEGETEIFRYSLSWRLPSDLTFESKLYHWNADFYYISDFTAANFPGFPPPDNGILSGDLLEEDSSGIDLLLKQAENALNTQWALGLSYKENSTKTHTTTLEDYLGNTFLSVPGLMDNYDRDVTSVTLEARSKFFAEQFHVLYGGRYDDYSDFGSQSSPRLGFVYLQDTYSVKLLYGEAFRAPTVAEVRGAGLFRGDPDIAPEVIETLEFVVMFKQDNWKVNITLFESEWSDGIVVVPLAMPTTEFNSEYTNIGENESEGIEISFDGHYQNTWFWNLSASYVKSEAIFETSTEDYSAFPKYLINLDGGYQISEALYFYITNRIQLDATEGPFNPLISDNPDIDDLWITSVNLDWSYSEHWNFDFSVINLFDQDNNVPSIASAEFGTVDPNTTQRAQVSVAYTF
ncbi:MAG: TonB-dependent receptor [Pseudomonadota bacterium]